MAVEFDYSDIEITARGRVWNVAFTRLVSSDGAEEGVRDVRVNTDEGPRGLRTLSMGDSSGILTALDRWCDKNPVSQTELAEKLKA